MTAGNSPAMMALLIVAGIVSLIVYMLPASIAFYRGLERRYFVLVLTLFVGGTGVGWFVALYLALQKSAKKSPSMSPA